MALGILSYFSLFSTKISEALKHVGVCVGGGMYHIFVSVE